MTMEKIESQWREVDDYFERLLIPADGALDRALEENRRAGLPAHDVSPAQGRLLYLLATLQRARSILEIGTLGGYSTLWLARALSDSQRGNETGQGKCRAESPDESSGESETTGLITLEVDPKHAAVARANLEFAGLSHLVDLWVGRALDLLPVLQDRPAFDLIFIDADKPNNQAYLEWAVELSRSGTVIVLDNVVRNGAVADENSTDPSVLGVRRGLEFLARDPRFRSTAIQTVGTKGWDGFALAIVDRTANQTRTPELPRGGSGMPDD